MKVVNNRTLKVILSGWLLGLVSGQALAMPQAAAAATDSEKAIVVDTAKTETLPQIMDRLRTQRLIYVGETHTSLSDHLLQLQVLSSVRDQGGEVVLGVEWFQRPYQAVLDRYIAGEIGEAQLLRESDYFRRWGFDYRLYRGVMRYAREHGIRVLALNASRDLTQIIMREGLEGLSEEQRARLPAEYDFDDPVYTEQLKQVMGLHENRDSDDPVAFRRFLEVQLTWDETMAETAADYLRANPDVRMVVMAGKGHTHASAIPKRVERRTGIAGVSIASYQPGAPFNQADFLVLQDEQQLPPQGLIGVGLDERDGGVFVGSFSANTLAEDAGVKIGDRILALDDDAVEDYADIKLGLMDRKPGDTVRLLLLRKGFFSSEHSVRVEVPLVGRASPH